jgi:hypothetical protein
MRVSVCCVKNLESGVHDMWLVRDVAQQWSLAAILASDGSDSLEHVVGTQ